MKKFVLVVAILLFATASQANWLDKVDAFLQKSPQAPVAQSSGKESSNSNETDALKFALKQGVDNAIKTLGAENGFLNNSMAKISLPQSLQTIGSSVTKLGGGSIIENFEKSMNDAASHATPKTAKIFYDIITNLSFSDVQSILNGGDGALTEYFKKSSYDKLSASILPVIKEQTQKYQITSYYKNMMSYYDANSESIPYKSEAISAMKGYGLDKFIPSSDEDLDTYVTKKAIDGIFGKIELEEKSIRANPLKQGSNLLRSVFGKI